MTAKLWVALILLVGASGSAAGQDWPTFMGDPQRSGYVGDSIGPRLPWSVDLDPTFGRGSVSPVVVNGRILVAGTTMVALDLQDGHQIWNVSSPEATYITTPALGDGAAVTSGIRGTDENRQASVIAIELDQGGIRWEATIPQPAMTAGTTGAPIFVGGRFIVPLADGIVAFSPTDGHVLWRIDGEAAAAGPAKYADAFIYGSEDGVARSRSITDGRLIWEAHLGLRILGPALVVNQTAYLPVHNDVVALDATTGETSWRVSLPFPSIAPQMLGSYLLFPSGSTLYAFSAATGRKVWATDFPDSIGQGASVWGGIAVVFASNGIVYFVDETDGRIAGQYRTQALWTEGTPAWDGRTAVVIGEQLEDVGQRSVVYTIPRSAASTSEVPASASVVLAAICLAAVILSPTSVLYKATGTPVMPRSRV